MKLNIVPARTGFAWVREGLRTYIKRPLAFTGLFFMVMLMTGLIGAVPLVGVVLALALLPVLNLGFMAATKEVLEGRFPMPKVLFLGLTKDTPTRIAMLKLGAFYALGFLLILGVSALVDGGQVAKMYLGLAPLDMGDRNLQELRGVMWLTMALYVPLAAAFWHAPALLYWHGVPPAKSLFFSLVACWRNLPAFTLYIIGWMLVLVSMMSLILLVVGLVTGGGDATTLYGFLMPLTLIAASIFFASMYATFRDCFDASAPNPETTEPWLLK